VTILFDRKVYVTVAPNTGGVGKKLSGLRMNFSIEKHLETTPNPATLEIFNLSRETRALFEEEETQVMIDAGYGDNTGRIFSGDIMRCITRKEGPDFISRLDLADGFLALTQARVDRSFRESTAETDILKYAQDLLQAKNLKMRADAAINAAKAIFTGYVASGTARKVMDEYCENNDLEWSVQNGEIQVLLKGKITSDPYYKLNMSTGLVGSPTKSKGGVSCTTLMLPDLYPGRGILLDSLHIKGEYRVVKVIHNGDTHEGQFVTEIEAWKVI